MIKQKTILISFSKQTIEIPTQNQDDQLITYANLYNKIKSEFNIEFNFDIFTSETNTLLNADNFTSVILNLTDDIIELYLIVKSQLPQKFNKASNISVFSNSSFKKMSMMPFAATTLIKNQTINEMIKRSTCSICLNKINKIKYECAICEDCTLCEDCELKHEHPVIKFKTNFLASSRQEIYHLINITDKENCTKKSSMSISYISLTSNLINDEIKLVPHVAKTFYIEINNKSGMKIPKESFILIAKDYHNLILNFEPENKEDIMNKDKYKVPINIKSNSEKGIYEVYFYFRTSVENGNLFKINSFPLKITINVVNDEEEKMMCLFFGEYNEIQVLPVNKMKIIYNIINEGMSIKNPLEIYKILNEAKWNIQKCIEELL